MTTCSRYKFDHYYMKTFYLQTFFNLEDGTNLNGYTVILPSVCVGNVAQLTADLLISTLQMKKVGTFWHVS